MEFYWRGFNFGYISGSATNRQFKTAQIFTPPIYSTAILICEGELTLCAKAVHTTPFSNNIDWKT